MWATRTRIGDRSDLERLLDRRLSNPIEVIEQSTYRLFLRRLDDLHTLEENKSARVKGHVARRVFPAGQNGIGKKGGRPYDDLRGSRFKRFAAAHRRLGARVSPSCGHSAAMTPPTRS